MGESEAVSSGQFDTLFGDLSSWGRWGQDDERGALHLLTPARVAAAVRLVRDGVTVTLSLPLNTHAGAHNPKPADHHMTALGPDAPATNSVHFIKDYVGLDYHNDGHTHIDALCHVAYEGNTSSRGPPSHLREQTAVGVPVRRGTAAHRWRHRLSGEPDRGLLKQPRPPARSAGSRG